MTFQDNLRQYREKAGYTAKDFAAKIGVKYTTYAGYESQGREPKFETLCQIADALHVTTDDLLGYSLGRYEKYKQTLQSLSNDETGYSVKETRVDGVEVTIIDKENEALNKTVSFQSRDSFCAFVETTIQKCEKTRTEVLRVAVHESLRYLLALEAFKDIQGCS